MSRCYFILILLALFAVENNLAAQSGNYGLITLAWTPNYTVSNEVTEILETDDLSQPLTNWTLVFIGATNQCTVPMLFPQGFFIAGNLIMPNS